MGSVAKEGLPYNIQSMIVSITKRWLSIDAADLEHAHHDFEGTLGGKGGQTANFQDDCPVPGTGEYECNGPRYVGLTCFEDMLV